MRGELGTTTKSRVGAVGGTTGRGFESWDNNPIDFPLEKCFCSLKKKNLVHYSTTLPRACVLPMFLQQCEHFGLMMLIEVLRPQLELCSNHRKHDTEFIFTM